jgi:hypothetical protein
MRQADINKRAISGISEYRWLSRAEIAEGESVGSEDMVQVLDMLKDLQLDRPMLKDSKVMNSYSRMMGVTIKDSVKELERRSKLISASYSGVALGDRRIEDAVCKYTGW